jgi:cation diffusion facilitator CzcD-associated flavoprotein CzcO
MAARVRDVESLARHEAQVVHDLACLNYPPPDWMPETIGPDGRPMLDVLVVGAGMCGQTAAFGLRREGIGRLRIIDRNPEGEEGPWATYARMEMLRSPKQLTAPDLGIPSLTFRAWYEAQYGRDGWDALYKVWRLDWRDYLLWVRKQVGLQIENRTSLRSVVPQAGGLRVTIDHAARPREAETLYVRKLVLALGREGSGAVRWPCFPSLDAAAAQASGRVFHSSDDLPFERFQGLRVGVLGVGASGFDNAARALEANASAVTIFARRHRLPQVNKSKSTSFAGYFRGFSSLQDTQRLRVYRYIFDEQTPPPFESVLRCDRHANFEVQLGQPWLDVSVSEKGVAVTTPAGRHDFDAVILATGFDVNLLDRPELRVLAADVMTWGDRSPDAGPLAGFPYLGDGFELVERTAGRQPLLKDIHLFNWGSTISHGGLSGDIPGVAQGVNRLANALVRDLFVADASRHYEALLRHDELELAPTRFA